MRIITHMVPQKPIADPESQGLKPIRSPQGSFGILLASTAGFLLLIFPTFFLCWVVSLFALPPAESHTVSIESAPWSAAVLALILFIPLHEAVHLIFQPGMGRGDNNQLICIPAKLRFGVYYEGSLPLRRWVMMRLAPFILLTIVPIIFVSLIQNLPFNIFLKTMMEVITVLNGVGSGADVVAALVVLFQVPASASMVFQGGKAYWKPAV